MIQESVLATSHMDSHGVIMPLPVLESIVRQANSRIIPLGTEHDPRIPPRGRVLSARIEELEDGHHAVVGTIEFFEEGTETVSIDDRNVSFNHGDYSTPAIIIDKNYQGEIFAEPIKAVCEALGIEKPQQEIKQSQEFISILTFVGGYILAKAGDALIGEVSKDAYKVIKNRLKEIFKKRENDEKDRILVFISKIIVGEVEQEVEIILSNPSGNDIDKITELTFENLINLLSTSVKRSGERPIARIIINYENAQPKLNYILRKDGSVYTESGLNFTKHLEGKPTSVEGTGEIEMES